MSEGIASLIVTLISAYAAIGFLFALLFVTFGVTRVDHAATGTSIGFRVLLLPGSMLLWPLLLLRWMRAAGTPPAERNAHRKAAQRSS